eukprot:scaffold109519_cov54-Phaeocystis_antarctica.AAC.2
MEVVATVPQELVLVTHAGEGWAARLTEAVLTSRAQGGEGGRADRPWSSSWTSSSAARRSWVAQWRYAGWSNPNPNPNQVAQWRYANPNPNRRRTLTLTLRP